MHWPLEPTPVSPCDLGKYKHVYLGSCPPTPDSTMVWGTTVDMTGIEEFLQERNRDGPVLVTPAHVLLAAVGRAIGRHACMRCRVIGKRVFRFKNVNVAMASLGMRYGQADVLVLEDVDRRPVSDIAGQLWKYACESAVQRAAAQPPVYLAKRRFRGQGERTRRLKLWLILHMIRICFRLISRWNWPVLACWREVNDVVALVNYLGFKGAPPLTSYKPSKLPMNGIPMTVTMGPTEPQPVAIDGQVTVRPLASLFVRSDHRIADAREFGSFVATLRDFLAHPMTIEQETGDERPLSEEPASKVA